MKQYEKSKQLYTLNCLMYSHKVAFTSWTPGPEKVGKHASGACRQQPSFVGTEGLREGKKRKKKKEKKGEEK